MPGTKRQATHSSSPRLSAKKARLDSKDLFSGDDRKIATELSGWKLEDLPGAEVFYLPEFVDLEMSENWFKDLDNLDTWYHPTLKVYGKAVTQSRSISAYATSEEITVKYSGHQVALHYEYPEVVTAIQSMVEGKLGVKFNHVMLNRYQNGDEYIGKHRDTKENKVIACLSLGAERTFILTPNKNCPGNPSRRSLRLRPGSLLVMQGDTQKNWKHEIPKESKIRQGRISLTFRQLEIR